MAYKKSNPNGQAAMSASEPVVIASDQSAVPVTVSGVSTAANQTTIIGHVDGIETLIGTTNTTLGTIDTDTGNISTKIDTLAGAVTAAKVQVDVVTMPSTTVTATDLDVRPLVNTDVVTAELSAVDNAVLDAIAASVADVDTNTDGIEALLTTIDGDTSNLSVVGGGTEATAIRVTLANDSTGLVSVDDNGSTLSVDDGGGVITVDGTVTANATLAAETTKVIGTVRVASGGIASGAIASGAIAAGAIAAGATSIATTEDTASAAADHLVKVAAIRLDTPVANANVTASGDYTQFALDNKQKLWTADNQIEDDAHATGDRGSFMLGVRVDTPNTASSGANADYTGVAVNKVGSVRTALLEEDFAVVGSNHVKKYYTNSGAVTDGIVWSPAAGKRWYVTDIFINTSAAATITLEDDLTAGDAAIWKAELAANSGWSHHFGTPLFSGEDAADLIITTSAGNVYVTLTGYEI